MLVVICKLTQVKGTRHGGVGAKTWALCTGREDVRMGQNGIRVGWELKQKHKEMGVAMEGVRTWSRRHRKWELQALPPPTLSPPRHKREESNVSFGLFLVPTTCPI